jgi:RNA polymerase sigma-70 factor (ECF subfamily)
MSEQARPEFSRVYGIYYARILAHTSRLIGREEADDVTQEIFAKVSRSLGTLSDPSKLASWIYAVAINTIRDAARARASRLDRPSGGPGAPGGDAPSRASNAEGPEAGARTPEEIAIQNEMVACYLEFVDRLPPDHREVYVLSEFEGLSNVDLARRLSLSVGAAKIRLHRARAKLNEELRCHCRCYYNERGELMAEPKPR